MTLHTGERKFLGRTVLVSAALLGMLAFAGAPRASADDYDKCQRSPRRTTDSTKPRSITVGKAGKPSTRGTNCARRGNAAGMSGIVGGMKTAAAGTAIATGMTMITIGIAPNYHEGGFPGAVRLLQGRALFL